MSVDPEYQLDEVERQLLVAMVGTRGMQIFRKIAECEVEKFKVALLNKDVAKDGAESVLAAHNLAKAAAQFTVALFNRVNIEMEILRCTPREGDPPLVDNTIEDLGA